MYRWLINQMKNRKISIYFCDLAHDYLGTGTYMFPINIGYIAAYANKFYADNINFKLFKYPNIFINEFKKSSADIVGFGNYQWNADLNNRISQWIKSISPETMIVFGPSERTSDFSKSPLPSGTTSKPFTVKESMPLMSVTNPTTAIAVVGNLLPSSGDITWT